MADTKSQAKQTLPPHIYKQIEATEEVKEIVGDPEHNEKKKHISIPGIYNAPSTHAEVAASPLVFGPWQTRAHL